MPLQKRTSDSWTANVSSFRVIFRGSYSALSAFLTRVTAVVEADVPAYGPEQHSRAPQSSNQSNSLYYQCLIPPQKEIFENNINHVKKISRKIKRNMIRPCTQLNPQCKPNRPSLHGRYPDRRSVRHLRRHQEGSWRHWRN